MDLTIEQAARVCHESNRAYCQTIGDNSQKPWDEAAQWQRDSATAGVRYKLEHPLASPADQHLAWVATKLKEGWKLGPVKNPEKKEHPCIVPYEQLPAEQKIKDYLFVAVVRVFVENGLKL